MQFFKLNSTERLKYVGNQAGGKNGRSTLLSRLTSQYTPVTNARPIRMRITLSNVNGRDCDMTKPELKRVLKIVYILIKAYSGKKFLYLCRILVKLVPEKLIRLFLSRAD